MATLGVTHVLQSTGRFTVGALHMDQVEIVRGSREYCERINARLEKNNINGTLKREIVALPGPLRVRA